MTVLHRPAAWFWLRVCVAVLVAPLVLGACDTDTDAGAAEDEVAEEASPEVEDIADDYFGNDEYLGETVTISAEVTNVITGTSFVVAGEGYGDESLLVISTTPMPNVQEGQTESFTGTVQQFNYDEYAGDYGLDADEGEYESYGEEEFLLVDGGATPSPSPA